MWESQFLQRLRLCCLAAFVFIFQNRATALYVFFRIPARHPNC